MVVDVSIGTDAFPEDFVTNSVKDGGIEALTRLLAHMPDEQTATLAATKAATPTTANVERAVGTSLP